MANGDFQKGTWYQIPSNCTKGYWLTWTRCAQYGAALISECQYWIPTYVQECVEWAWQETTTCSWWSWLFCVIFAVILSLVCIALGLVTVFVCAIVTVVEYIFCLLWTTFTFFLCTAKANGGTTFLLTDGTAMMQESGSIDLRLGRPMWATNRWWKLTPDQFGSYANGTWSQLADSHVARRYFASSVLADGRVVVCGGEYSGIDNAVVENDNNTCEIYDPVADRWTMFDSPKLPDPPGTTWTEIGDAPCAVLPDGTFLLGAINGPSVAKLDPATLTWTAKDNRSGVSSSNEDSWVLMPNNTIAAPSCTNPPKTWVYDILHDHWTQGNDLNPGIVDVDDNETGPALLRYDGTGFFLGANEHTAVFTPTANPQSQWSSGPDLPDQTVATSPQQIGIQDGPAALLVNGNVLFGAGVKVGTPSSSPSWFFEFDGTTFNRTNDPPNNVTFTYATRLLLLPNGDVLFCTEDSSSFYAYHSDAATPQDSFRPVIQTCPTNLTPGGTIQISGLQFNGLSQAVAYGDDAQMATNYPLVRIVNKQTNHVRYCRTFNHTTVDANGNIIPSMGVATGAAVVTTNVAIPDDIELGDSSLFVVANGIPSLPFDVAVWSIIQ
jgi:Kelch motif